MKKIILAVIVLACIGGIIGYKMYNQPKDDINDLEADTAISAETLVAEYTLDEQQADKDYLGKVLEVEGEVVQIETGEFTVIILKGDDIANVRAQLVPDTNIDKFKDQKNITIKGKCSGTLLDVTLNDCIILK